MAAPFSMSKESEKYVVIAAFPCKCETDEGLASPYGRGAPAGAERACFTLSVGFAARAKEKRIVTGGSCAETFCKSWNIRIDLQFTGR